MTEMVKPFAEWRAAIVESLGIGLIVLLALHALVAGAVRAVRGAEADAVFHDTRQRLGRGILLGLELLVAADIIHTVAVDLTFTTVGCWRSSC